MKFYRGIVVDNQDPDMAGRVRVRVFGMHTEKDENSGEEFNFIVNDDLPWSEVMGSTDFGLNSGSGTSSTLDIDTWVWCFLENDDPNKIVVFGTVKGGNDLIGSTTASQEVYTNSRVMYSDGHSLEFNGTPGQEAVRLAHQSGSTVTMDSGGEIKIYGQNGGQLVFNNKGTIDVDGKFDIRVNGDVAMNVTGNVTGNIAGNSILTTKGNSTLFSLGNITSNSLGTTSIISTGDTSITATGNTIVGSAGTLTLESAGSITIGTPGSISLVGSSITSSVPIVTSGGSHSYTDPNPVQDSGELNDLFDTAMEYNQVKTTILEKAYIDPYSGEAGQAYDVTSPAGTPQNPETGGAAGAPGLGTPPEAQVPPDSITPVNPYDKAHEALGLGRNAWIETGRNPNILHLWKEIGLGQSSDKVAWCAVFANAIMKRSGNPYLVTSNSQNCRGLGTPIGSTREEMLANVQQGDLVIFYRNGADSGFGHVGFATGNKTSTHIEMLGGNQSDTLRVSSYPISNPSKGWGLRTINRGSWPAATVTPERNPGGGSDKVT